MKEIKDFDDLKGKTIIDYVKDGDELWIKYSDDSFSVFVINDITEGFGYRKEEIGLNHYSKNNTDRPLVELGFISEEECESALKQEEIECEKHHKESILKEEKRVEDYEKEQLRILSEKYLKS